MTVWLIGIGFILLLMKWLQFGPVANWSWWLVLTPLFIAFFWFEVIEPMFGLDKKRAHDELAKVKEERIKEQLERNSRGR
jgi:small Trp-rich protein